MNTLEILCYAVSAIAVICLVLYVKRRSREDPDLTQAREKQERQLQELRLNWHQRIRRASDYDGRDLMEHLMSNHLLDISGYEMSWREIPGIPIRIAIPDIHDVAEFNSDELSLYPHTIAYRDAILDPETGLYHLVSLPEPTTNPAWDRAEFMQQEEAEREHGRQDPMEFFDLWDTRFRASVDLEWEESMRIQSEISERHMVDVREAIRQWEKSLESEFTRWRRRIDAQYLTVVAEDIADEISRFINSDEVEQAWEEGGQMAAEAAIQMHYMQMIIDINYPREKPADALFRGRPVRIAGKSEPSSVESDPDSVGG